MYEAPDNLMGAKRSLLNMMTYKLGGYLMILGSILMAIGMPLSGSEGFTYHVGATAIILGCTSLICASFALREYLLKNNGNGLITFAPILTFIGYGAMAFSYGMMHPIGSADLGSVNAARAMGGSLFASVGSIGFLGYLLFQLNVFGRTDFGATMVNKTLTGLAGVASVLTFIVMTIMVYFIEGREAPSQIGVPGDLIISIPDGLIFAPIIVGFVLNSIWGAWIGLALSQKS